MTFNVAGSVYHIAVARMTGKASLLTNVDVEEMVVILKS